MSFTAFIASILGPIIRPIIREELAEIKQFALNQANRLSSYEKHDKEADEIIAAAEKATTTEEVKAHVRRLKETRATLHS